MFHVQSIVSGKPGQRGILVLSLVEMEQLFNDEIALDLSLEETIVLDLLLTVPYVFQHFVRLIVSEIGLNGQAAIA